jgi:hypothetical protein
MKTMIRRAGLVAATLVLTVASAKTASNAEQIVFSTPGFLMPLAGNSIAGQTPFGFWIWCAGEPAESGGGEYQNANACQGSMYFYGLEKRAEGVIGFVQETDEGIYQMTVFQGTFAQLKTGTLNPKFICTLENVDEAAHGPTNAVAVACQFPGLGGGTGSALVTNAVVNVTGERD